MPSSLLLASGSVSGRLVFGHLALNKDLLFRLFVIFAVPFSLMRSPFAVTCSNEFDPDNIPMFNPQEDGGEKSRDIRPASPAVDRKSDKVANIEVSSEAGFVV